MMMRMTLMMMMMMSMMVTMMVTMMMIMTMTMLVMMIKEVTDPCSLQLLVWSHPPTHPKEQLYINTIPSSTHFFRERGRVEGKGQWSSDSSFSLTLERDSTFKVLCTDFTWSGIIKIMTKSVNLKDEPWSDSLLHYMVKAEKLLKNHF